MKNTKMSVILGKVLEELLLMSPVMLCILLCILPPVNKLSITVAIIMLSVSYIIVVSVMIRIMNELTNALNAARSNVNVASVLKGALSRYNIGCASEQKFIEILQIVPYRPDEIIVSDDGIIDINYKVTEGEYRIKVKADGAVEFDYADKVAGKLFKDVL